MSNLFLKKARVVSRVGFALVIGVILFAACGSGSSDGEETAVEAVNSLKAFRIHGIAGNIDAVKKTVNAAVPYFEGIDTAALDVEVSAEEGAMVIPLSSGTGDFSAPKTFTITANGVSTEYTVTVYVLFHGEAGLAQLYDYADPDAKLYTEAKSLYAAISGIEFGYTEEPAAKIKDALRNQCAALELSRCTGAYISAAQNIVPFKKVVSVIFSDSVKVLTVAPQSDSVLGSLFKGGDIQSVKLSASLEVIGSETFYNCKDLKTISGYTFGQSGLESVEFNEGPEEIGEWAFA